MIRRSKNVAAPLKVCFPGGAVETGEDRDAAALREMHEEVGLTVELIAQVWRHDFTDRALTLYGYLAKLNDQAPRPCAHEVAEIMWLTTQEAGTHPDAMPMTDRFVAALEQAVVK